jgi:hypothetical protein
MTAFLDSLSREAESVCRITSVAKQTACRDFGDLWWDKIDLRTVFNDPGVMFSTVSRMFVVARVNGELRYYAGGLNICDDDYAYELGVVDDLHGALTLAEAYLVRNDQLDDIPVARRIRQKRLPR